MSNLRPKHTPGPWTILREYSGAPAGLHHPRHGKEADDVCYFYPDDDRRPSEADVQLMKTAPELLEKLALMTTWKNHIDDPDWRELVEEARAVIDQATSESE